MEHGHLNPTAFVTTIDPRYIKELPISGSAGIFNYVSVINCLLAHDPTCGCGAGSAHLLENCLLGGCEMTFALIIVSDI